MNKTIFLTAVFGLFSISRALTLDEAFEIARMNSPGLRAAQLEEESAGHRVKAAGVWKNPILDIEAEGVGGDNESFDEAEYGVMIKQDIPLGGRFEDERNVANREKDALAYGMIEVNLALMSGVKSAYFDALAQQEIAVIRDEQEKLGREFISVAEERHDAGGGSEMEVTQAYLALEEILIEKQCCFGDLDAAKKELASLMGIDLKNVGSLTNNYYILSGSVPKTVSGEHPRLKKLDAEIATKRAEIALAGSKNIGNLRVGAGVKYEPKEDAQSFVVSAMIPLSIRKKGRLEQVAATLEAEVALAKREQMERTLQQELNRIAQTYTRSTEEAAQYKKRMIPMAQKAYEQSREGYDVGRYSWMELLTAQQNLAGLKVRYVEALLEAHKASAQLKPFRIGETK